jgi:pimeloyl-ACP methyl ester carboxylesterase
MIQIFWKLVKIATVLFTIKNTIFKEEEPEQIETMKHRLPRQIGSKIREKAEVIPAQLRQHVVKEEYDPLLKGIGYGLGITAGVFATIHIINKYIVPSYAKPPKALPGDLQGFEVAEGVLNYYQDGEGDPIILIHSINAGASSHEMEEIFNYYRYKRSVYALDLLGYGLSDRPDIPYSPELYIEHLKQFFEYVKEKHNKTPDVVALSLSTEYIVKIAEQTPELIHKMVLISPTGLEDTVDRIKYNLHKAALYLFRFPVLGQGMFNALTSRVALKNYLQNRIFVEPRNLSFLKLQQYYYTTHVKGAKNSPSYFVAGELFVDNIFQSYLNSKVPALIVRGTGNETITQYDAIGTVLKENKKVKETVIENGGLLPYIEKENEFFIVTDKFLG